jgi:hypothetical protein
MKRYKHRDLPDAKKFFSLLSSFGNRGIRKGTDVLYNIQKRPPVPHLVQGFFFCIMVGKASTYSFFIYKIKSIYKCTSGLRPKMKKQSSN